MQTGPLMLSASAESPSDCHIAHLETEKLMNGLSTQKTNYSIT